MASTHHGLGARPADTYPNTLRYDSPSYPPHNDLGSVESDLGKETLVPAHKMNYSNASEVRVDMRSVTRTPSPTPSETAELKKTHLFDFRAMSKWKYWVRREWLWYYVAFVIIFVTTILFTVYHKQIVNWLQPTAKKIHDLPAGWLIPIAIFFVISFPPLFGHEILAILCGLVWGLWPGFAIVAAGTFVGEVGNFYAFKYCCAARGEKMEKTKIQYACLARVVREGGFKIALIARFSAIPGHFTTAVFSTCGMGIWTFMLAALLSLPKQFLTVYLGVALEASDQGQTSTKDTIIRDVVIGLTTVVTFVAMWYIYRQMNKVKPQVIYERRKARQAKMMGMGSGPYGNSSVLQSTTDVPFNPRKSESELPLNASFQTPGYQQWDSSGRAVGYTADPTLYAPQPQRPVRVTSPASHPPSRGGNAPTSTMRQNTSSSTTSWDAQAHVGGPDAYPMRASPYKDPYSVPPKVPNAARASPSPRPYGNLSRVPVPPMIAPINLSTTTEQTPIQSQFSYGDQEPQSAPLPNPFAQSGPPPLPSDSQREHYAEPTDLSFHTAYDVHAQYPSNDAYPQSQQPYTR